MNLNRKKNQKNGATQDMKRATKKTTATGMETNKGYVLSSRFQCRDIVESIKRNLSAANLLKFKRSCFGRFLDVPSYECSEVLMSNLVSRIKGEVDVSKLVFDLDDYDAHFTEVEFYIITGLKFGPREKVLDRSYFHGRAFDGEKILYVGNVHSRFVYECNNCAGTSGDSYNLAMILFVYGVLLNPVGRFGTPIDLRFMHVIDNIDSFNAYPWGLEAYHYLIESLNKAAESKKDNFTSQRLSTLEVGGLRFVIKIWAFETFPDMAINTSYHEDGHIEVFPRMMNKWVENGAYMEVFSSAFRHPAKLKTLRMTPTVHERSLLATSGIEGYVYEDTGPDMGRRRGCRGHTKRKLAFETRKEHLEEMDGFTRVKGGYVDCDSTNGQHAECNIERLRMINERAGRIGDRLQSMQFADNTPFECIIVDQVVCMSALIRETINELMDIRRCLPAPKGNGRCATAKEGLIDSTSPALCGEGTSEYTPLKRNKLAVIKKDMQLSKEVLGTEALGPDVATSSMPSPDWNQETPEMTCKRGLTKVRYELATPDKDEMNVIDLSGEKDEEVYFGAHAPKQEALMPTTWIIHATDPLAMCNVRELQGVLGWYNEAVKNKSNFAITTPMRHAAVLDAVWFEKVIIHYNWLRTDNCDVLLNLLMHEAGKNPESFSDEWTALDALAFSRMDSALPEQAIQTMLKYIRGIHPLERPKPWSQVKYLYGIANVMNFHWVAYKVDIYAEKVSVYDSLALTSGADNLTECFTNICRFLPTACRKYGVFNESIKKQTDSMEWLVEVVEGVPQQENSHDCGIMAIKFIECLVRGLSVSNINSSHCAAYRHAYCAKLWGICKSA